MAQQNRSTTTAPGQTGTQTGDLGDNEAVLVNQDMINNSNVMDNTAAKFLPQQHIPPQNRQHRPAPDRQRQQSQSLAVDVQRNPIQNPLRTQTLPPKTQHCHVDPQTNF